MVLLIVTVFVVICQLDTSMEIAAAFKKSVRYEHGQEIDYGDLIDYVAGGHKIAWLEKASSGAFSRASREDMV